MAHISPRSRIRTWSPRYIEVGQSTERCDGDLKKSEHILSRGFVRVEPLTGIIVQILAFQLNPATLSRSLVVSALNTESTAEPGAS